MHVEELNETFELELRIVAEWPFVGNCLYKTEAGIGFGPCGGNFQRFSEVQHTLPRTGYLPVITSILDRRV